MSFMNDDEMNPVMPAEGEGETTPEAPAEEGTPEATPEGDAPTGDSAM